MFSTSMNTVLIYKHVCLLNTYSDLGEGARCSLHSTPVVCYLSSGVRRVCWRGVVCCGAAVCLSRLDPSATGWDPAPPRPTTASLVGHTRHHRLRHRRLHPCHRRHHDDHPFPPANAKLGVCDEHGNWVQTRLKIHSKLVASSPLLRTGESFFCANVFAGKLRIRCGRGIF